MNYKVGNKTVKIPDDEIQKNMKLLSLSEQEAIQMWLEDEGYEENAEVEKLTAKAKANKINHEAKAAAPRKASVKRERKPDEEKEKLVEMLAKCLMENGISVNITNKSKIIEFSIGENAYKLDLIKKRPSKTAENT